MITTLLQNVDDVYTYIRESGDSRGNKYPLVAAPTSMALTIVLYLIFVQSGPRYFKTRPPLSIKPLIIAYNFFMVLLSAYMFKEFLISAYSLDFSVICQPTDKSPSPASMRMVSVAWLFYISKFIELSDTVFMVVRKKGQLTFLHVFHHSTVIFHEWAYIKYIPSSHAFFQAIGNSFIHIIMYLYYFLACFPQLQKYLWWKKYLTILQMIQFMCFIINANLGYFLGCLPQWTYCLIMFETIVLLFLFGNYFVQTHSKIQKRKLNGEKVH